MGNFDRDRVRSETGPGSAPGSGAPDRRGPAHELTIGFGLVAPNRSRTDRPPAGPAQAPVTSPMARTLRRAVAAGRRRGWTRPRVAVPIAVSVIATVIASATGVAAAIGRFLDFYAGVFTLVALSVSVMLGLLATDRMVLLVRHRLYAQAVHRAAAFTAIAMLVIHVLSQVLRDRAGIGAFVPFTGGFGIGLGTVAGYLLIMVIGTAIARGRFAASTRPWLWRGLHCTAYVAWPLAIAHGLTSGRTPAGWVTTSYGICLAAVVFAVLVRFLPGRRG
jgi:hypothetical protein